MFARNKQTDRTPVVTREHKTPWMPFLTVLLVACGGEPPSEPPVEILTSPPGTSHSTSVSSPKPASERQVYFGNESLFVGGVSFAEHDALWVAEE